MNAFDRYVESLVGSWRALAAPHHDAVVARDRGFVASRFPRHPVFNNAALLNPASVDQVLEFFRCVEQYAVWSGDDKTADALQAAGLRRDITTRPMHCRLDALTEATSTAGSVAAIEVEPALIADLNEVSHDLLEGVTGLRAFASEDLRAGLVVIEVGDDANISFVATRPDARRTGLATLVTSAALRRAQANGFSTASLQATPMAERLYGRLGFKPVGLWQEWTPDRK
jgi:GNAT superfamily N-acetyltransferase